MAKYRKIDPRIWNDAKFMGMSDEGKLVFFFLLTHPHMTALGAMRATLPGLAEEIGWDLEAFREAFREAFAKGMAKHDSKACLIALPNFIKYNPPESPNVVKAWSSSLDLLPECTLKYEVIQWVKGFTEGLSEAFGKALPEAFAKAMPNQEQEQEQELEKKSTTDVVPKENQPAPQKTTPKPKPPARTKTVTKADMRKDFPDLRDQTIDDWLAVRKAKKAPLTPTAWEACVREINQSGLTGDQAITIAAIRGWQGIKADWLLNHISGGQPHGPQGPQRNNPRSNTHQDNSLAARVRRGSEQRLRDMGCSESEIRGLVGSND